ncbi:MAG TPA: hypothetical protein VET65_12615 [Candidatus Limnocylindrales bacterium]|nr:hypothetical protein [Candidatus Limnocylindrales bacterium]
MGYFRGLRHGAMLGAALALLYAPDAGAVTRRRLARWLGQVQGSLDSGGPAGSEASASRARSASGRFAAQPKRQAGAP